MRRFSDRHALHTVSELNVTPLLDLAFVLLIIFMITAPIMENKVELALPTSEATKTPVDAEGVQSIALAPDGYSLYDSIQPGQRIRMGEPLLLRP